MSFMPENWKQQLPGALSEMSPLLLAMSQGLSSGQGAFTYAPQGMAAMQAASDKRAAAEKKKKDLEALSQIIGGGMPKAPQAGGNVARNTAMAATGGPTKAAAAALDFSGLEKQYNLPSGYLARTAQIESAGDPNAKNPNSSAGGLFQFIDSTAQQYGLADRFDPAASADAAARLARDNAAILKRTLGRDPTSAELYLAHQQGAGGAARLLSNPNARASDIVGEDAVRLNGGDLDMTAGQFAGLWTGKFGGEQASSQPSIDPTRAAQLLMSDNVPAAAKQQIMSMLQGPDEMEQVQLQLAQAKLAQMQAPPATEPQYTQKTGAELGLKGENAGRLFNVAPDGKITQIGGGATNITNTVTSGGVSAKPLGTKGDILIQDETAPSGYRVEQAAGSTAAREANQSQYDRAATIEQAETALSLIKSVKEDPALPNITGNVQGRLPAGIPLVTGGQAGTDLSVKIEQLQGQAFLQAFESLKGGGQITQIEGEKATNAIARLQTAQSDGAYIQALNDLEEVVNIGLRRARAGAPKASGENPSSPQIPDQFDGRVRDLLEKYGD